MIALTPRRDVPSRALVVASAPKRHTYTRHLRHPAVPVAHLATTDATYRAEQVMHPDWVEAHADVIDVFHTHFGFGDVPLDQMDSWVETLDRHRIPLVHTVHDLHNPHVTDQEGHVQRMGRLLEAADAVVTLTPQAAQRIPRRHLARPRGAPVPVHVVPHPFVVAPWRVRPRPPRGGRPFVIGIHCKDQRAGIDAEPFLAAALTVMRTRPDVVLRVDLHHALEDTDPQLARRIRGLGRLPRVQVHTSGWVPDEVLWDYLAGLDLAVLPYAGGTHSGWAEACVDLGTPVAVPSWMPAAYQHRPPRIWPLDVDRAGAGPGSSRPDVDQLATIVDHLRRRAVPVQPLPVRRRADQRLAIARRHAQIYRDVLADLAGEEAA